MEPQQQIRAFISDTFFVENFSDQDSFLKNGIIDSTGMMELVAFLESTFGIEVADSELVPENLDSLANLAGYLARKRVQAA